MTEQDVIDRLGEPDEIIPAGIGYEKCRLAVQQL